MSLFLALRLALRLAPRLALRLALSLTPSGTVEISFMPSAIASGPQTVFHYEANITPPRSWSAWGALIEQVASALVKRYGDKAKDWAYEVWNEVRACACAVVSVCVRVSGAGVRLSQLALSWATPPTAQHRLLDRLATRLL